MPDEFGNLTEEEQSALVHAQERMARWAQAAPPVPWPTMGAGGARTGRINTRDERPPQAPPQRRYIFGTDEEVWNQMNAEQRASQQSYYEEMIRARHKKYPELVIVPAEMKRRVNMPTFKLEFDSISDLQRRILHTLIYIGRNLYYVREAHEENNEYILYVSDGDGHRFRVSYSEPQINLRNPEPRYINFNGRVAYVYRIPARAQSQSFGEQNTRLKYLGDVNPSSAYPADIIKCFSKIAPTKWDQSYYNLMVDEGLFNGMRLSNNVAIGLKKRKLFVEYKGRNLGSVDGNVVTVETDDYNSGWIGRDCAQVGLALKEK